MKLIQALSELKLIRKKIDQNHSLIGEYSSACSLTLKFKDEAEQVRQVDSLVQSTVDLLKRYAVISMAVDRTNLATVVSTEYGDFTLSEMLLLRGYKGGIGLSELYKRTYAALSDRKGDAELQRILKETGYDKENPQRSLRFYDPAKRDASINHWLEFQERISALIEVKNAETDLIE